MSQFKLTEADSLAIERKVCLEHMTISDYFKITNVEHAKYVLNLLGGTLDPLFKNSEGEMKLLDSEVIVGHPYQLYSFEVEGEKEPIKALKMLNPSTGEIHIEPVSPDCRTVRDARRFQNQDILDLLESKTFFAPEVLT